MRNKDCLDEMQRERRGGIGSQMFTVMSFALLANIALYGAGLRWLEPPSDTMAIVTVCLGVYLVRLIIADAYRPAKARRGKTMAGTAVAAALATGLAAALAVSAALRKPPEGPAGNAGDYSAVILLIFSASALLAALTAALIKKTRGKTDEEDDNDRKI